MTDEPTESAFERAILGHEPTLTAEEVAERSGLTLDQARRLWRTLGFPDRGADRAFTESDVDAMSTISGILDDGLMDFDVALNVTRGIGLSMARLADWEVGALIQRADALYAARDEAADESSSLSPAARLTREYGERFEELLMYSWRRHLIAALGRMESARAIEDVPGTTNLTVGFADIVGFTSLSNEVSRARIGDIVETFESRCGDVIASKSGRLIKAIGDAVLFVNDDPYLAFQTAEGIINVIGRDQRMPDVRVVWRPGRSCSGSATSSGRRSTWPAASPRWRAATGSSSTRTPPTCCPRTRSSRAGCRPVRSAASAWSSPSPYAVRDDRHDGPRQNLEEITYAHAR